MEFRGYYPRLQYCFDSPDRILLLTFTRRAAAEMLRRAGGLVDRQATGRVWGGTFHSIANRLLRRHATAVGLTDGFTVLDQSDAAGLFGLLRAESGFAEGKTRFPRKETISAIYSRAVNAQEKLGVVLDERFPWCRDHGDELKEIFRLNSDSLHLDPRSNTYLTTFPC